MSAFAYLRKSYVRDPARTVSYAVQEGAVRELAKRHGDNGESLTILSDWDKSGRLGRDKRPGYAALLEAIESGRCTAVYSYSLSRLGRSVAELARLIADCEKRGIPVRLYADSMDTSTASGKLLFHVLASVAAFEADVASERVRAAIAAKVERGEKIGSTPAYGERDGEDVQVVLDAFAEAGSYSGAARLLNQRGVKPRHDKPRRIAADKQEQAVWWASSVAVVVKRADPSALARRGGSGTRAGPSHFILARLLRCPTCGTRLSGTRDRIDGPNKGRVRYACRLGSVTPHRRVSISEHMILEDVKAEVARLQTPERVEERRGDVSRRTVLGRRRENVLDMYEAGHIDRTELDRRMAAIAAEEAKLQDEQLVSAIPRIDWSWEPRTLNRVLRALFVEIELDPATFKPVGFEWTVPEWRRAEGKSA